MNNVLNNQAAMLAVNDCFWVMGWIFIALIFFLPFGYQRRQPHLKLPAHASAAKIIPKIDEALS